MRSVVLIVFIILSLSLPQSTAQTGFRNGAIKMADGSKITGQVYLRNGEISAFSLEFRQNKNSNVESFDSYGVNEVVVNGKVYLSKSIIKDNSEIQVFAELLASGKINLFHALSNFYIEISNDSQITSLQKLVESKQYYIEQLSIEMDDCPVISRAINNTVFSMRDLTYIVGLYNNCASLDKRKIYKPIFSLNLGAGLAFTDATFKSSSDSYFQDMACTYTKEPVYYFSWLISSPRNKNTSFGLEFSQGNKNLKGYSRIEQPNTLILERYLDINYKQFSTSVQFIQYLTMSRKVFPYYSLGVGLAFLSDKKTKLVENISTPDNSLSFIEEVPSEIVLKNRPQFSASIGVKTAVRKNYSIKFEMRFEVQGNQIISEQLSQSWVYSLTPVVRLSLR